MTARTGCWRRYGGYDSDDNFGEILANCFKHWLRVAIVRANHNLLESSVDGISIHCHREIDICLLLLEFPNPRPGVSIEWLASNKCWQECAARVVTMFSGRDREPLRVQLTERAVVALLSNHGRLAMAGELSERWSGEISDSLEYGFRVLHPDNGLKQGDHIKPFVLGMAKTPVVKVVAVNVDSSVSWLNSHWRFPKARNEKTALRRSFRPKSESTK